ncbi:MAG: hypothetical protein FWG02_11550 [Holophagaceae bacterium]|nr:hypothetical protein [Holophagaceae bacterium]
MPRTIAVAIKATKRHCNKDCQFIIIHLCGLFGECHIFNRNECLQQETDPPYRFIRCKECIKAEIKPSKVPSA